MRTSPTSEPSGVTHPAGPKPTDAELDVYGLTHPGKVRTENQDHFLICQLKKQIVVHQTSLPDEAIPRSGERLALLAMVADGVGGGVSGEEASRLAVEAITRYVSESIESYYRADPSDEATFSKALSDAALRCHDELVARSGGASSKKRMATTLTMLVGVWPRAYLVQVGDSRYYLLREGGLVQVTRDQTIAQDLIDQGVLSRGQARRTPWANVLSSAIGGSSATPVVTRIENDRRYVHLLCSDGLTKHVSDDQIARRLSTMHSARQACEELLEDALAGGGSDNISMVVGWAKPATPQEPTADLAT